MSGPQRDGSWRIAPLAVTGLVVAIAVIGLAGIAVNGTIQNAVERAIAFDVELEDRGDDLRVAVLEVRHYHRDLLLNSPDSARVALWEARYEAMRDEVEAVEALLARQPEERHLPDVGMLRSLADAYHAEFSDVIREERDDPAAFRSRAEDLLVPIDDMQRIAQLIDRAGEELAAASFAQIDQASSTGTWILLGIILAMGITGVALGLAVLRLVAEQRRLVVAEQAAATGLAQAARARSDFIADASHELRTPLTVLRGNAEVGLSLRDDCTHAEILRDIVDESSRMSRLVDDMLFLARSDAAGVPLDFQDVDVADVLHELEGRAELLAREHGAHVTADLRASGMLRADAGRIGQAFLILVDNAAKYGPPGGTVQLAASAADGRLTVEVLDRGAGIPADHASRIFERFYRVRETRDEASDHGTGLGLAIASAIVEGHAGAIEALPRPGGGTVMRVILPMLAGGRGGTEPADPQPEAGEAAAVPGSGSSRGAPSGG